MRFGPLNIINIGAWLARTARGLRDTVLKDSWLRLLNPPQRRQLRALLDVFSEADRKVAHFKRRSGLACLPRCGECCNNPRVESTVFEMTPLAYALWARGELEPFLEKARDAQKPGVCIFYTPVIADRARGHCSVYRYRPLLCRLYGFSSGTDKYQRPFLLTCRPVRALHGRNVRRVSGYKEMRHHLPSMADLSRKAAHLDPHNGVRQRPINEAALIAFDRAGLMMSLKRGRPVLRGPGGRSINMDSAENNKQNLGLCYRNGLFSGLMTGLTQEYFTPFILLLGAAARHVGLLNALPNFFAALVQIKGAETVDRLRSRKRVVALFSSLQAVTLAMLCVMALAGRGRPGCRYHDRDRGGHGQSGVGKPSVRSGPGTAPGRIFRLVEPQPRFRRHRRVVLCRGRAVFPEEGQRVLRLCPDFRPGRGLPGPGVDASQKRGGAPVYRRTGAAPRRAFRSFIHRLREDNFSRFVLFVSVMSFSVNLASPFFAVLMLRDLKFNYLLYSFITTVATVTVYLTMGRWGRHADRIGNLKVIRFTAPLIGVIPLLWVANRNPFFLVFAQIFSGFLWAGFNLCSTNFIYDAVPPPRRTRAIAYFNVLNGLSLGLGALTGGFVLNRLPPLFGYNILTLLVISSGLRIAAGLLLPFWIREVRPIQALKSNRLFFSMLGIRPVLGVERKTIRF